MMQLSKLPDLYTWQGVSVAILAFRDWQHQRHIRWNKIANEPIFYVKDRAVLCKFDADCAGTFSINSTLLRSHLHSCPPARISTLCFSSRDGGKPIFLIQRKHNQSFHPARLPNSRLRDAHDSLRSWKGFCACDTLLCLKPRSQQARYTFPR